MSGYTTDFSHEFDHLICQSTAAELLPKDFENTEMYRFEGMTDPAGEAVGV